MIYPKELEPISEADFNLSTNEIVKIPKANIRFEKWLGEPLEDDYKKTVLNFNSEPLFAELIILRILQNEGWKGVWVDSFRRKYRTDWINKNGVELPSKKQVFLNNIYKNLGSKKGCWDIFCWKDEKILFIESKQLSKDKIRETQVKFLESALNIGLTDKSFLIVEWTLA